MSEAVVSLLTNEAVVRIDTSSVVAPQALVQAVEDAGFGAEILGSGRGERVLLQIGGMTCASCSGNIEATLTAMPGWVADLNPACLATPAVSGLACRRKSRRTKERRK